METKRSSKFEIDMIHGPLLGKILIFTIPLISSGILQLLFNAADIIVVGRFTGSEALAAVGSTGSMINLLTNLFLGLSIGTNVVFARFVGAGRKDAAEETLRTSVLLSFVSGLILMLIGILAARPILVLMGSPENVIGLSTLYLRIYFVGMPAMLFYNFGSAILRAVGDTRRPLLYLSIAGIINVFLNLFFVICFHMGVAGVALATIISQTISAVLLMRCMMRMEGYCHLDLRMLHFYPDKLKKILAVGIPAGLQGVIFSVSNVLIQSSINSFGSTAMAGSAASSNIEGFVYVAMNSFHQTCVTFTSQNYGAGEVKRIPKILLRCILCVTVTGLLLGNLAYLFGASLISIYNADSDVIAYGLERMKYLCVPYFACGIMDVMVGAIRGMGYSVLPMIVSFIGACLLRIVWIFTVFRYSRTLPTLYLSYPISWVLTLSVHVLCFVILYRKLLKTTRKAVR